MYSGVIFYIIKLSLEKNHPDVTDEKIEELIASAEDAEKISLIINNLMERTHGKK